MTALDGVLCTVYKKASARFGDMPCPKKEEQWRNKCTLTARFAFKELSGMDPGELTTFGVSNLGEVTVSDANMKKVVLVDLTAGRVGGDGHRFCIAGLYELPSSVYAVIQSNASLVLRHCEPPHIYALGERPAMFLRGDAFSEWWKKLVEAVISDDGGAAGDLLGLKGLVFKAGKSGFTVAGGVW
eukprot:gene22674-29824_t